jgi:hypothetical protein
MFLDIDQGLVIILLLCKHQGCEQVLHDLFSLLQGIYELRLCPNDKVINYRKRIMSPLKIPSTTTKYNDFSPVNSKLINTNSKRERYIFNLVCNTIPIIRLRTRFIAFSEFHFAWIFKQKLKFFF